MKRISPGPVTVGVIAILSGLLTAYAACHYFGTPAVPASSQQPTPAVLGCKNCKKNQCPQVPAAAEPIPPVTAAATIPTLAPPQDTTSLAAGGRFEQGPRGHVVYVQVEAEGAGSQNN